MKLNKDYYGNREIRFINNKDLLIKYLKEELANYEDFDGYAGYDGKMDIHSWGDDSVVVEFQWFKMILEWLDTERHTEWVFNTIETDFKGFAPWDATFISLIADYINNVLDKNIGD